MTMRAPALSEPKSTFPTYKVPQLSAMRGRAPPVQVARAAWGVRANPPSPPFVAYPLGDLSVIPGSSCCPSVGCNSNIRMQSVTENCLLNSVTVPKIQRIDLKLVAHNNSSKLDDKFGAFGQDIPNQKSDDLEVFDLYNLMKDLNESCDNNDNSCNALPDDLQRSDALFHRTNDFGSLIYSSPLRLRGGGESSGTSSWGSANTQPAGNNNANNSSGWGTANPANQNNAGTQQWNTNSNRPPASNQGPTSQDANKTNSNITAGGPQPPTSQSNNTGWGQPGSKSQNANNLPTASVANNPSQHNSNPMATTNSTTKQQLEQLSNMREAIFSQDGWGGQHVNQDTNWDIPGSPEPPNKIDGSGNLPWKPSVNNGTELWEANLRNGGQPPPQPQQKAPWGHTPSTNIGGTWGEDDETDSSNVWTGVPSTQQQWGGNNSANGAAMWGGPKKQTINDRQTTIFKKRIDTNSTENEWGTVGNATGGWGADPRAPDPRSTGLDPRDMRPDLRDIRTSANDSMRIVDPREQLRIPGNDMRGDPRGITGRLNGAGTEAFWNQAAPHSGAQHMHHQNKIGPGSTAGWEEPSPPSQRRNMPNYDDGTSLWGNPQQGSHWKDMPTGAAMGRGGVTGPPGMAQPRISLPMRNGGSWDDGSKWDDHPKWQKPKMPVGAGPLWDNEPDWGHKIGGPNQQQFTKEMVWNSKQFRCLVDMGFKKEDVENALRLRDMNFDEALDFLSPLRKQEAWRRADDDHFDHQQFPGQGRFTSGPPGQMSFPPGNNSSNMLNNMNTSGGANNSLINNISPAVVQKMLTQGAGGQVFAGGNGSGRGNIPHQQQPSTQQLRMLVQQIQMAVQAGYLNHQILNQPLAPQTLVLLNQLLQQIKALQQLSNQQQLATQSCMNGKQSNNATILQCSVLITKTKQQISNLQNQIAAQQAIYVKQQHQSLTGGPNDFLKNTSMHDSINSIQTNFADLGIKDPQLSQQQSRLNQWIKPEKEEGGEFSRAPGSSLATSPNMNPLGLTQPDGPWSSGRSGDTGWPDPTVGDVSNDKEPQWPTTAQPSLTDLVPEFEPGKPWKGTQIKSIEDDPSITPGSVVRSPLSIATIKDNELFSMNPSKSPPTGDIGTLSSSTWSFNPPSSTTSAFTSPQSKIGNKGLENTTTAVTSELWGAPKSRGPPPGLSTKSGSLVNGWSNTIGSSAPWGTNQQRSSNWMAATSQWLLLRNLTAQIDGSTLRTLCMQHGPLLSFHLHLHQGFALAKYSSREEATKAQTALNNCVLGNTTILAENPTDWDANTLLQTVASQGGSSGGWRANNKQPGSGGDTWSSGWSNNNPSANLWGTSGLDVSDAARATPSSLNSFLPGDLLGGESI
ncbi:protein Gawky isoform X3 [Coccinella septempunctata]|uniref:protein Gawky isoform X3 n=1 Tax=Coccinella septempunctata TaxID=41139 RepID=UPI001D063246|nr:protein Gawky isoform X3 [Coccinella septempunctata]